MNTYPWGQVEAFGACQPSTFGPSSDTEAVDVCFVLAIGGVSIAGEVTLIRDDPGWWKAWGVDSCWISPRALHSINSAVLGGGLDRTEILKAIEAECADCAKTKIAKREPREIIGLTKGDGTW